MIVSFLVVLLFSGCQKVERDGDDIWDLLALGLPDRITPEIALINTGYYILKQTHEPIFRNDNGEYYSKILDRWVRSVDDKNYMLCPNKNLSFNEKVSFSVEYLEKHLKKILSETFAWNTYSLAIKNKCVLVAFNTPVLPFLHILTFYENSPSIKTDDPRIETGLGSFYVVSIEPKVIKLKRKTFVPNGYNYIKIWSYEGSGDPKLGDKNIEDFNRVYVEDLPNWVQEEYENYGATILQSINLVINHHNKDVRDIVYNCVDISALRKALMPGQIDFQDIGNILPIGVSGAMPQKSEQTCHETSHQPIKPLMFINWKKNSHRNLEDYFKKFTGKTNVPVSIQDYTTEDFIKELFLKKHKYNLAIIALDAVRPDHIPFYEFLINNRYSLFDIELNWLRKQVSLLPQYILSNAMEDQIKNMNSFLKEERLILPLYQEVRRFYFPRKLKNYITGQNFLEYPEISRFTF